MAETFRWLHLTDLHWGAANQKKRWSNIKNTLFDELKKMSGDNKLGAPWDAVFFTGDLVNRGTTKQFQDLNAFLLELWQVFKEINSNPVFLPIPGNHDLARPSAKGNNPTALFALAQAFDQKLDGKAKREIRDEVWNNKRGNLIFKLIKKAFSKYEKWWAQLPEEIPKPISKRGIVPGDFSTTLEVGHQKIGVVGLNTAFLQLQGGNYFGKLALDTNQLIEVCGDDFEGWARDHQVRLLLTHHPLAWLSEQSKEEYLNDIAPEGRFALHLSGHVHKNAILDMGSGSGLLRRYVGTLSLFGNEIYMDRAGSEQEDRVFGFGAGRIDFADGEAKIRIWSKEFEKKVGGGYQVINARGLSFADDGGTEPFCVKCPKVKKHEKVKAKSTKVTVSHGDQTDLLAKVAGGLLEILENPNFKILQRKWATNISWGDGADGHGALMTYLATHSFDEIMTHWHQGVEALLKAFRRQGHRPNKPQSLELLEAAGWLVLLAIRPDWKPVANQQMPFLHLEIPVSHEFSFEIVLGNVQGVFARFFLGPIGAKRDPLKAGGAVRKPKIRDYGTEKRDLLNLVGQALWDITEIDPNVDPNGKTVGFVKKTEVSTFQFNDLSDELKIKIRESMTTGSKVKPFFILNPEKEKPSEMDYQLAKDLHAALDLSVVAYGGDEHIWTEGVSEKLVKVKLENYINLIALQSRQ